MLRDLRKIHPHARLWIITAIILGLLLVLKTPAREIVSPPHTKLIVYYTNDYQRYAIERLTIMDDLEQYPCLIELWNRESHWRPKALNRKSKASGIAQLTPDTWQILNIKPTTDGYKQVDAGLKYIERHYGKTGAICRAYAHHLAKGWY